jgi:hypothetical protein
VLVIPLPAAVARTLALASTVYLMDSFSGLIADKWELPLPIKVHNVSITQDVLMIARATAPTAPRNLVLVSPYMRGDAILKGTPPRRAILPVWHFVFDSSVGKLLGTAGERISVDANWCKPNDPTRRGSCN